jgi:hypothetical protein
MNRKVLTFCVLFAAPALLLSDDFKTVNGKEYKDASVKRVEPDGILVKTKSGMTKIYFSELPKEVQERFHYDPQKATAYAADQSANYATYQQQHEQTRREQEDAAAKNKAALAEQQAATNRIQSLQNRYTALQQEENALLVRIGEAKQPGPAYYGGKNNRTLLHHPNPQKSQLPLLQGQLSDVRHEKTELRKQLDKTQR